MGVDVATWVDVIRRHPLKFKFQGLDGFHTDVREAATHDEQFMEKYTDKEVEYYEQNAHTDFEDQYADFLREEFAGRHNEYSTDAEIIKEYDNEGSRWRWASRYVDPPHLWEMIREGEPDYLLKEHPPEQVLSHAYSEGIAVEDVWFLCPSCHREPFTKFDADQYGGKSFYCGLCGASSCLGPEEDLADFIEALDIEEWPFKVMEEEVRP